MTPSEYIAQIEALFVAERHQEALDLSVAAAPDVHPALSLEELERVYSMMEVAATIVSLDEAMNGQQDLSDDTASPARPSGAEITHERGESVRAARD